jgi:hypothetical protein
LRALLAERSDGTGALRRIRRDKNRSRIRWLHWGRVKGARGERGKKARWRPGRGRAATETGWADEAL